MADVLRSSPTNLLHLPFSSPLLLSFPSLFITTQKNFSSSRETLNSKFLTLPSSCTQKPFVHLQPKNPPLISWKLHAGISETDGPKWWERVAGPNMIDIHSTQDFLNALSQAGDKLVIVEFYGTWCGSCRALFPKLCKIAEEHPEILFLKVNFDENKPMCKSLNVKVLPFFHFYRGADGMLESFSCSLAKFQKLRDAISTHNTDRCSIGPPKGVGDLSLVESPPASKDKPAEASPR